LGPNFVKIKHSSDKPNAKPLNEICKLQLVRFPQPHPTFLEFLFHEELIFTWIRTLYSSRNFQPSQQAFPFPGRPVKLTLLCAWTHKAKSCTELQAAAPVDSWSVTSCLGRS